ncbi:MAG: hypothetical protein Q9227_009459 [Pyrenula ochraceoflavens]
MGAFDALNKKGTKPLIAKKKISHVASSQSPTLNGTRPASRALSGSPSHRRPPNLALGAKSRAASDTPSADSRRSTPTTLGNSSPRPFLKSKRPSDQKRASPAVLTPRFSDSDDSDEPPVARKRQKVNGDTCLDPNRRIRSKEAFQDDTGTSLPMIHAADIAHLGTPEKPNHNYTKLFAVSTELDGNAVDTVHPIELEYPSACPRERFFLVRSTESDGFKPVEELKHIIRTIANHYLPEAETEKVTDEAVGLLRKLTRAYNNIDEETFRNVLEEFNAAITNYRKTNVISNHLDSLSSLPLTLVETILTQIYARTVSPRIESLRRYENGTDNVYGELLPRFVSKILSETKLKSNHIFVDLGSGVGNVVLQVALQTGCESWGCEMMPNACELAELQRKEFIARCHLWGLQPGTVHLERGDFLENQTTLDVLKRADLVLVNNQAFTPKLNDDLKRCFLDMKEGAQIVSLKGFVGEASKRNVGDVMNVFFDEKKEFFSGSVSWTDAPGTYHIARKDSRRYKELNGHLD